MKIFTLWNDYDQRYEFIDYKKLFIACISCLLFYPVAPVSAKVWRKLLWKNPIPKILGFARFGGNLLTGIAPGLAKPHSKTKVLMVHGVGDRLPGYSTEFLEKLAKELKLTAKASTYKDIQLMSFRSANEHLGEFASYPATKRK